MKTMSFAKLGVIAASLILSSNVYAADGVDQARLERAVDDAVHPLMAKSGVPGMAIGVTVEGKRYVFNYGVASRESGQKVTGDTLFEIGSISKTFTATLASYAATRGTLSFSDKASKYMPALAGSSFDKISLLDLGTYTAGGLPLQFPDSVTGQDSMVAYFRGWRPAYAPGTHRLYSNPSIGLFGHLAAASLGEPFDVLMERKIFPGLGLSHTYIHVPGDQMGNYAYGYSKAGKPLRVTPGALDAEAYGVKTTAADMLRFLEVNLDGSTLDETMRTAVAATHAGYYRIGDMRQGLGWESYAYPIGLDRLLAGNSSHMSRNANKASKLVPPQAPHGEMLFNKTGSTGGFAAYAVFVPARRIGIVILANRNYPIPERIEVAYRILAALDGRLGAKGAD
ncbi:MAG: beta-lactamase [Rhizobium sp.]